MNEENSHPGVSGKSARGETWVDLDKLESQREFIEDYEEKLTKNMVLEAFMSSPEVDANEVDVEVEGNVVTIYGTAEDVKEERAFESIAMNVPGVAKVISRMKSRHGHQL